MILRLIAAALLTLGVALAAPHPHAQLGLPAGQAQLYPVISAPSYTGPGDIASTSFTAWWGLRAYDAAAASATVDAVDVNCNSTPGTAYTIHVTSAGNLNTATILSDCTTSTFSGSMVGTTTLSTTGDSCAAIVGAQVIGAGITSPTTVVSKTSCSGGAGVYVLSQSFTISAESMTALLPVLASKLYDQTGGNACTSASCNVVQATGSEQPGIYLNCLNGATLPCLRLVGSSTQFMQAASNFTPATGLVSMSVVGETSTAVSTPLMEENGANNFIEVTGTAGTWRLTATANFNFTASASTPHSVNGVVNTSGLTSVANVDGTETSTTTLTGTTTTGKPTVLSVTGSSNTEISEVGFADNVGWSSTTRNAVCSNQYAYWGTATPSGSC